MDDLNINESADAEISRPKLTEIQQKLLQLEADIEAATLSYIDPPKQENQQ